MVGLVQGVKMVPVEKFTPTVLLDFKTLYDYLALTVLYELYFCPRYTDGRTDRRLACDNGRTPTNLNLDATFPFDLGICTPHGRILHRLATVNGISQDRHTKRFE